LEPGDSTVPDDGRARESGGAAENAENNRSRAKISNTACAVESPAGVRFAVELSQGKRSDSVEEKGTWLRLVLRSATARTVFVESSISPINEMAFFVLEADGTARAMLKPFGLHSLATRSEAFKPTLNASLDASKIG
jgi:hypothetical protein